jgi:hypothetical protein
MEVLLEELIELHTSSPTFRHAFKSKSVLNVFVTLTKSFVSSNATPDPETPLNSAPLLDKLIHLALMVNLAGASDPSQKREVGSRDHFTCHDVESLRVVGRSCRDNQGPASRSSSGNCRETPL